MGHQRRQQSEATRLRRCASVFYGIHFRSRLSAYLFAHGKAFYEAGNALAWKGIVSKRAEAA